MKIIGLSPKESAQYIALLSKIESGDNPLAKAKSSTASGRFQFIKSTWEGLGYNWKDVFNDKLQYEAVEKFTNQNAKVLQDANCAINFATLYGAHFLGVAGFLRIMRATPSSPIEQVTTAAQRKANPTILKGTVKDFTDWLKRKTGHDYTLRFDADIPVHPPGAAPEKKFDFGGAIFVAIVLIAAALFVFGSNLISGN